MMPREIRGWRVMLKLAWRTALRSKGRTVLVAVLVGLPVFAGVVVDIVVRANTAPAETYARWTLGAADARLEISEYERIEVNGVRNRRDLTWGPATENATKRDPRRVDAAALLPTGSRLVRAPESGVTYLRSGDLAAVTSTRLMRVNDPMARGMTLLRTGRFPKAANEVAVTTNLGRRLGLIGSRGRLRDDATVAAESTRADVVGVVDLPGRLNGELAFLPPGTGLKYDPDTSSGSTDLAYLVDLPALAAPELHALADRLAAQGVMLTPRDAYLNPRDWVPPDLLAADTSTLEQTQALALGLLCVGFGLLEVVLLAGAAFAVGARRQVRELGLIAAAAGGTPRDVRRLVLAQGVVLGLAGALGATVLALGVPPLAGSLVERVLNHEVDGWPFAPLDYLILVALGTVSGLAAAVVPAVSASRMAPIDALAGRFRSVVVAARPSKLGIGLLAAGLATGICGSWLLSDTFAELRAEVDQMRDYGGGGVGGGIDELLVPLGLCLASFALTAFGLVRLMPAIVGWLAAVGRWLPLTVRLAFRDGSRHRHRTGPAAAAIMVAVAVSVGVAFLLTGSETADRASYNLMVPVGTGIVSLPFESSPADRERLLSRAGPALAKLDAEQIPLRNAVISADGDSEPREVQSHSRLVEMGEGAYGSGGSAVAVADGDYFGVYTGVPEPELAAARRALRAGEVVVLGEHFIQPDGTAWIWDDDTAEHPQHKLPAHLFRVPVPYTDLPSVIVGTETAKRLGWSTQPSGLLVRAHGPISQQEEDVANGALSRSLLQLEVERGYQPGNPLVPMAAVAAAGVVTLAGVAISVALSASESRADLATLAAIGAPPRRRRMLAAAQALLVGGLGCLLGILLGWSLAFAVQAVVGAPEFTVPWTNLLATAVLIPLFAALCAALFTRSRLPMMRRAE